MKPKHLSLVSMLLAIVIVGLSSWYVIHRHGIAAARSGFEPIKPLSELKVPDASVLKEMDRLERNMHLLSVPPAQFRRAADLSALGYVSVSPTHGHSRGGADVGAGMSAYRVTLAFDGQGKRFCVIDSELYPEGAALPDGATII